MIRVLMSGFRSEPEELARAQVSAAERVIRSGWYLLGRELERFEAEWAAHCERGQAVGVANGMDALEIGLRALGIGAGDEVVTTPMTAFATVLAVLRAGATPVLADVENGTGLLDPRSVERCITPRTRAVLLVHLYGRVAAMDRWRGLCDRAGILLLEDCAQAHLARWRGTPAGGFGAWGAFSFYPTKNLGALGDAGALVTDSPEIADAARSLRNYGQTERYHHPLAGLNSRLDEIQAAILSERLRWLERFTLRRRAVAVAYGAGIRNAAVELAPPPDEEGAHVHHLFPVFCDARDRLAAHLAERGVETHIHYPVPAHRQEPAASLPRDPSGLGRAECHARRCLSIPCHPQLGDDEVSRVIDALNAFR